MDPKRFSDSKDEATASAVAPPANKSKPAAGKGERDMNSALKSAAGSAPMPRKAADVARVARQVAQSRHVETEDDQFDTESIGDVVIRPARPPRAPSARKQANKGSTSAEAELQKRVETAVRVSLNDKKGRKRAIASKDQEATTEASAQVSGSKRRRHLFPFHVPHRKRKLHSAATALNGLAGCAHSAQPNTTDSCRNATEVLAKTIDAAAMPFVLARVEPLDINCIDLPSAMPQDALPLMESESRRYYTNIKPLPLDKVRPARAHLAVLDGHYEPFIRQTIDIGMDHVWYQHELKQFERHVENGLFTLHKAGKEGGAARSQRVILDARPGNGHVETAPNPQMPDHGSLGEIILDRGDDWAIGTTDLSV